VCVKRIRGEEVCARYADPWAFASPMSLGFATMGSMDPFVAAVRAELDDDLPRLIYADYLEERGDPRGTFIRTQVELAQLPADDPRRQEMLDREAALLAKHENEWLGPLSDELVQWGFQRGFLEVSLSVNRFLDGEHAWLDGPTVAGVAVYADKVLAPGLLARLVESPRTAHVHSLNLSFEWVKDAGAALIAGGQYFQSLLTLLLGNNGIGDEGAMALADSPNLISLRCLWLRSNLIGDAGMAAFADSATLAGLRQLDLTNNEITSAGALALAESPRLTDLKLLKVSKNRFDIRSRGGKALKKRFGDRLAWK
jgi:uncharacterized protein (TIGR02996 family)